MNDKAVNDSETGLPIIIPGMTRGHMEAAKCVECGQPAPAGQDLCVKCYRLQMASPANQEKANIRRLSARPQQGQPRATAHLDPNHNPTLPQDDQAASTDPKIRVKLRVGYVFYFGANDAYRGPCIMYLSPKEMEGQEHKFEILGATPAALAAKTKPIAVSIGMSQVERLKKITELRGQLEVLVEEERVFQAERTKAQEEAALDNTVQTAPYNPDADSAPIEPGARARPAAPAEPQGEPEQDSEPLPGEGSAEVKKRGPGRPPGARSRIRYEP